MSQISHNTAVINDIIRSTLTVDLSDHDLKEFSEENIKKIYLSDPVKNIITKTSSAVEKKLDYLAKFEDIEEYVGMSRKEFVKMCEDISGEMEDETSQNFSCPTLTNEARLKIKEYIRKKFLNPGNGDGVLFFRRVKTVKKKAEDKKFTRKVLSPHIGYSDVDPKKIGYAEFEQYGAECYKNYFGFTKNKRLVSSEPEHLDGVDMFFTSNEFCQIDMSSEIDFSIKTVHDQMEKDQSHKLLNIKPDFPPREDDLIGIYLKKETIDKSKKGIKNALHVDKWFISSEQFLRAFSLITEKTPSFFYSLNKNFKKIQKNDISKWNSFLRNKLFSGNRLMTNSWLKHKLGLEDSGKIFTDKESIDRYWHLRTEVSSVKWVDVYAAIILMAHYGEIPCPNNIPNNKGPVDPQRRSWSLPRGFVNAILKQAGVDFSEISDINEWRNLLGTRNYKLINDLCFAKSVKSEIPEEEFVDPKNMFSALSEEPQEAPVKNSDNFPSFEKSKVPEKKEIEAKILTDYADALKKPAEHKKPVEHKKPSENPELFPCLDNPEPPVQILNEKDLKENTKPKEDFKPKINWAARVSRKSPPTPKKELTAAERRKLDSERIKIVPVTLKKKRGREIEIDPELIIDPEIVNREESYSSSEDEGDDWYTR